LIVEKNKNLILKTKKKKEGKSSVVHAGDNS
jgi:hypothetical protein